MHLVVFSKQKPLFEGKVKNIQLPGSMAPFEVLQGHINLITTLERGVVIYQTLQDRVTSITIEGGVVKVKDNTITLLIKESKAVNLL